MIDGLVIKARAHSRARGKGVFWFGYSGHGSQKWTDDSTEEDGKNECICPVDHSQGMIDDDWLNGHLASKIPHSFEAFFMLDACHSGSAMDLPYVYKNGSFRRDNRIKTAAHVNGDGSTPGKVVFLSGCGDSQTSKDLSWAIGDGDNQRITKAGGALTFAFFEGISEKKADGPMINFVQFMCTKVASRNQKPHISGNFEVTDQIFWHFIDGDLNTRRRLYSS